MSTFITVYYDSWKNKMHLWELDDNGKPNHLILDHELEYYVLDKTGTSNITSEFGEPVVRKVAKNRQAIEQLKESGERVFESDIKQTVKFLQKRYEGQEIKVDIKKYNIFNVDIETEWPESETINLIGIEDYHTGEVFQLGLKPYTGENKQIKYVHCKTEAELLETFCRFLKLKNAQIVYGWNCLSENSSVWLNDRIVKISDVVSESVLSQYGSVVNHVYTGKKEKYSITLDNGVVLDCSDSHLHPIYTKKKGHYNNLPKEPIIKSTLDAIELRKENDIYVKFDIRTNNNIDLTYREYFKNDIKNLISNENFNFVIPDSLYLKYKSIIDAESSKFCCDGTQRKNAPYLYSYRQLSKFICFDVNDIYEMFNLENTIRFIYGHQSYNFDIDEIISYKMCRLLGLMYTDGTFYNNKSGHNDYTFYNMEESLLNDAQEILLCENLSKSPAINGNRTKGFRVRFGTSNKYSSLFSIIYGSDNKKKLNKTAISLFSYEQFVSFFGGCIDGDGSVTSDGGVVFCNYNDDINNFCELLSWNGILASYSKNDLRVKKIYANERHVAAFGIKHPLKLSRIENLTYHIPSKRSPSNKLKFDIKDDHYFVRVRSIEKTDEFVDMYDIETTTHLFNTNSGLVTHNCAMFDFPKIQDRIDTLRLKCSMSPIGKVIRKFDGSVDIVGIEILDSMELYKKFTFKNQPSFSLNAIGKLEVNDQKIDYEGSILSFWKSDWNAFCDYNCQDLKLVTKIEMKKKLIPLAIGMGTDSRIQFSDVVSPIAVTEGDLLKEMHENNMVMEDITHNIPFEKTRSIIGGHVESYHGFYNFQCSIDCTSMYPHNTMMYNISKETKVTNPTEDQIPFLIKSHIPGVYYKKGQGLLPKITKKSFDKRKYYKKLMFQEKSNGNYDLAEYYDSQQLIQKIKINAFFGASANPHFHFYDFDNASQITAAGRDGIQYVSQNINGFLKDFHKIAKEYYPDYRQVTMLEKKIYLSTIDTDSVYFSLEHIYKSIGVELSYLDFVLDFEKRILEPFLKKIMDEYAARYNTENLLHFTREKIILKSLVQAKKKYACLSIANEDEIYKDGPKLSVTGIETKKSDLCSFSRIHLNSLLELAFEGDRPDKQKMLKFVRDNYKEFLKQPITELAIPKGIGSMEKYESDISIDNKNFVTRTPIFNRASMVYNLVIKQNNFPYVEIKTGSKMKYIFVKPNNKYKTDVIGFIGTWPKEFDNIFKIDFDEQFDKQYLNVAQRLFDAIGLGLITLKDSKLLSLIEDD